MRLSDVKGERALDAVVQCIEPVANIATDPKAAKLFKRERVPKGWTQNEFVAAKLKAGIPALLEGHKKDVIRILSVIEGVDEETYIANLTMSKLLCDCFELITDEEFITLFISAQNGTGQGSSGSAPVNIAG